MTGCECGRPIVNVADLSWMWQTGCECGRPIKLAQNRTNQWSPFPVTTNTRGLCCCSVSSEQCVIWGFHRASAEDDFCHLSSCWLNLLTKFRRSLVSFIFLDHPIKCGNKLLLVVCNQLPISTASYSRRPFITFNTHLCETKYQNHKQLKSFNYVYSHLHVSGQDMCRHIEQTVCTVLSLVDIFL